MAIQAEKITKNFNGTKVLHEMSFTIPEGEFVSISGKSGSGKTTLLYILSTLDFPSSGKVLIDGKNPAELNVKEIHSLRNREIGFIFQFHYLLSEISALENILMPARKYDLHGEKREYAVELMDRFGLKGKYHRMPGQLSGGEQQRVAIARALLMNPRYIFADEPTGNLDTANGKIVMDLLRSVNQEQKTTIVLVTHEPDYAEMAERQIFLQDGRIVANA